MKKAKPVRKVNKAFKVRKVQRATRLPTLILPKRSSLHLKDLKVILVRKAFKVKRVKQVRLALTDKVLTLPLRLAATRTHRPIFTLTLPQCRGLRRRLRRFKGVES